MLLRHINYFSTLKVREEIIIRTIISVPMFIAKDRKEIKKVVEEPAEKALDKMMG
jgi:hypothetical protein